jgi:hypothetical protein
MTEVRGQRSENRRQKTEKKVEGGFGTLEVGPVVVPEGRDYAAAKDAEVGMEEHRAKSMAHSV